MQQPDVLDQPAHTRRDEGVERVHRGAEGGQLGVRARGGELPGVSGRGDVLPAGDGAGAIERVGRDVLLARRNEDLALVGPGQLGACGHGMDRNASAASRSTSR